MGFTDVWNKTAIYAAVWSFWRKVLIHNIYTKNWEIEDNYWWNTGRHWDSFLLHTLAHFAPFCGGSFSCLHTSDGHIYERRVNYVLVMQVNKNYKYEPKVLLCVMKWICHPWSLDLSRVVPLGCRSFYMLAFIQNTYQPWKTLKSPVLKTARDSNALINNPYTSFKLRRSYWTIV